MSGGTPSLRGADRSALVAMCALLALSALIRVHSAWGRDPGAAVERVSLGDGVSLTRTEAVGRTVWTAACDAPVTVDFIDPAPHGADSSLAPPRYPGDRVYYVYRGQVLYGRFAAMKLTISHFARQAGAMLHILGGGGQDERAIKFVVPTGCDATPDEVMDALRRDVRSLD